MRRYLIVAFMALLLLSGCGPEEYPHRFDHGDYVVTKLDGKKGMIIRIRKYNDGLFVRFAAHTEMTTDSFLGGTHDVTSKPYAIVFMHDYELMPFEQ